MHSDRLSAMAKDCMIKVRKLHHHIAFSDQHLAILNDINLEIAYGESVAIVGRSGSGKTTLLGLMAGLDRSSSGEIWLDGHPLSTLNEDERAALRASCVGFVFQSFQLLSSLTALENVMLPLELSGRKSASERAQELLNRVGLGQRLHHTPRQLSGGEQQRVAIARAFASEPKLLFADEPTGNLDSQTGTSVVELLMQLNREQGTTLVMVTHDQALAERCDRQFIIEAGDLHELSQGVNP